jgi:hypothetical protein
VSKDNLATIPNDLLPIHECAAKLDSSQSSFYNQMRKGTLTVHLIAGETQAKVSLSEATKLFEEIGRRSRFSAPTFRIVRHDEKETVAQPERSDLFA